MPRLNVVVGYCGSGKSRWLRQREVADPTAHFKDEGALVFDDGPPHILDEIVVELSKGRDVYVSLMECALEANRNFLRAELLRHELAVDIAWFFFRNDVERANTNCRRDKTRGNPEGNVDQNNRWSGMYSIPDDATLLEIFELPP